MRHLINITMTKMVINDGALSVCLKSTIDSVNHTNICVIQLC